MREASGSHSPIHMTPATPARDNPQFVWPNHHQLHDGHQSGSPVPTPYRTPDLSTCGSSFLSQRQSSLDPFRYAPGPSSILPERRYRSATPTIGRQSDVRRQSEQHPTQSYFHQPVRCASFSAYPPPSDCGGQPHFAISSDTAPFQAQLQMVQQLQFSDVAQGPFQGPAYPSPYESQGLGFQHVEIPPPHERTPSADYMHSRSLPGYKHQYTQLGYDRQEPVDIAYGQ
jgi:hypothetical protein